MLNHLTKSKYLNGLQCHKRLWYEKNHPERRTNISRSEQRKFDQGEEVGILARDYFPDGVLINAIDPLTSARQTEEAIERGDTCIFEASFIFNDVFVRCDVLQKDANSWKIIEVKASTINSTVKKSKIVKEEYLNDLAIQKYVLTGCGLSVSETKLMIINSKECVYPDLSNLFSIVDATDQVDPLINDVHSNVETFKTVLDGDDEPQVLIGEQCDKPYRCPFKTHCWEDVPAIDSIPGNQPEIDTGAIKHLLSDLGYPIHFLDFETDNPAIPRFNGLRPYQQFPFQYSCHVMQSDGTVTHHEYLHTDESDPRKPLLESLLNHISPRGSVVVYTLFERERLNELIDTFPQHSSALKSIINRLWDQSDIFKYYYKHPDFCGYYSLKNVLPVLVPWLGYEHLDVQEGTEAQAVWNLMLNTTSETKKNEMIEHLKAYCKLDTLATLEIHKVLCGIVEE